MEKHRTDGPAGERTECGVHQHGERTIAEPCFDVREERDGPASSNEWQDNAQEGADHDGCSNDGMTLHGASTLQLAEV